MIKEISIIGGDLRIVKLAEMLGKQGMRVYTFGLEKAENLYKSSNIIRCNRLDEAIGASNVILGPIPLSTNLVDINMPFSDETVKIEEVAKKLENKIFISGSIRQNLYDMVDKEKTKVVDLLNREELTVLNTISTAEGAIQIAMEETTKTIHGSEVLVLGYGRVGRILANMLRGIGAIVSCEARRDVELAWVKAYGYTPVHLANLDKNLSKYDIVINTIPHLILNEKRLKLLKKDALIIDLASSPGGVDREAARKNGIKTVWALSLPGKVAPLTSAEFIRDTLYNILKEI